MVSLNSRTLVDALLAAPPHRPFVTVWSDEEDFWTVTFGEFIGLAKLQAASFQAHGIKSGDRVILIMPQGIPLMASFAGAMLAGAVPAILAYPNFKVDPEKYSSGLAGVSQNLQARLIVVDEDFPVEFSNHLAVASDAQLLRCGDLPVVSSDDAKLPHDRSSSESLAFIQHSAGTTGLQKGVALSHAAVLTQLEHLAMALKNAVYVASDFAKMKLDKELTTAIARHAFLWESTPPVPTAEAIS